MSVGRIHHERAAARRRFDVRWFDCRYGEGCGLTALAAVAVERLQERAELDVERLREAEPRLEIAAGRGRAGSPS